MLRADRDRLTAALAERPDADAAARLNELVHEQEDWYAERIELRRQLSELQRRLAYADTGASEREVQRDRIASLQSQRSLLCAANRQLREEVDSVYSRSNARSPFPACMDIDANSHSQSPKDTERDIADLKAFVVDLQQRIACVYQDRRLYYSLADLRSFVGGLAMSRLLLLQGISGTGKTSLPVAFARAVGTDAAVVEVQAGWRDPQDLVGHYNPFDKRFHETGFIEALYRAQTPQWKDSVQIMLLDEMNLSHPEQYFSDLLSALELPSDKRRLKLMSHAVDPAPALFTEGRQLPIPENVWFVGTANHDETTKDFADKTYDRAHIMEFPHRPEPFAVASPSPRHPISCQALNQAFDATIERFSKHADQARRFLDSKLRDPLADHFEVGWGPRLERQIGRYVPVVCAAGGSVGAATDHVLATRLLRKLKHRHIARVREEQWDVYENRVPVRLVDNLVAWLHRRIAEVRRVQQDIFVRLAEFDASAGDNRHRFKRICCLWGAACEASHGRETAERTLRPLRPDERASLNLDRKLDEAKAVRDRLANDRKDLDDRLRQVRGNRRHRSELNQEKRVLLPELREAEKRVAELAKVHAAFKHATLTPCLLLSLKGKRFLKMLRKTEPMRAMVEQTALSRNLTMVTSRGRRPRTQPLLERLFDEDA